MRKIFATVLLAFAAAHPLAGQVLYGSLTGIVHDTAGAVIPSAAVKVVNPGPAQEFSTITNEIGSYTFTTLPQGAYNLTIGAKGFRTLVQRDIVITVNTVRREDLTLEVGQVNETVTVEAASASLQTDKADVHTEIGSREIVNIPLPHYRNYQSLINLVPGTTPGQYQNSIQAAPARALSINVNGLPARRTGRGAARCWG